jgi:branched-chain amino acid transport system permease protein
LIAPWVAAAGAALFGWFCVRLSGIYLAMLTLAFAQIAWSVAFQWDALTGGSNGLIGTWPAAWLASRPAYYWLSLMLCALGVAALWRAASAPFGYALRASRDSPLRAQAVGIDVRAYQWAAFMVAGLFAGLAGALFAFSKGSISPETLSVPRSVDGLVMVLLGGLHASSGPIWGAALFTWLEDVAAREIAYWRAAMGGVIVALVLVRAWRSR